MDKKLISLNVANAQIKDVLKTISELAEISYLVYSDLTATLRRTTVIVSGGLCAKDELVIA